MRIVHVSVAIIPVLHQFGGAIQRRIIELSKQQVLDRHEVIIYSPGDKDYVQKWNGVEIRFLRCVTPPPWSHIEFQIRVVANLRRTKTKPDVIHFHSQPEGAFLSALLPGRKLLAYDEFRFRGGKSTPLYYLYRYFLGRFNRLLPVSQYCLIESQAYWKLHADRFEVVYNGVNLQQFYPDPDQARTERTRLDIHKKVILYVGRVCHQKGTDILLEAMAQIGRERNSLQLVVVGPFGQFGMVNNSAYWEKRIKEVGGIYLGAVEEQRLCAIYNLADVFVMPTRRLEMFGMAAVEAQACGKPVVASDLGGLRETVPETCGARFEVGNAADLARKIEQLLDDQERYDQCVVNALTNAAKYHWSIICSRLEEMYHDA